MRLPLIFIFYPNAIANAIAESKTFTLSTKYPPVVKLIEPVTICEPLTLNLLVTVKSAKVACCTSIVPLNEPVIEPVKEPLKSANAFILSCVIEPENIGLWITIHSLVSF